MKLNCVRTNLATGKEKIQEHRAVLHYSQSAGWSVQINPGVTGYESFLVDDFLKRPTYTGWTACAGTEGSWDRLFIPQEEMDRLLDVLELLPIQPLTK